MASGMASAPARRARGRAPRLTRDLIVAATAELLRSEPRNPLTMARVADAVDASPMSLYRHFKDRDDLLLAVARSVLVNHVADVPAEARWQEKLRAWMRSNHEQATTYPQLIHLSVSGQAPVWMAEAAELVQILEEAKVPAQSMAKAVYWTATTTLGHCLLAADAPGALPTAQLYAALGELADEDAARVAPIIPGLAEISDGGFELVIDVTVASVEQFVAGRQPRLTRAAAGRR